MENSEYKNNFAFLSPRISIRSEHLSKKDVKKIKISLGYKIGAVSLILSIALLITFITLFFIMSFRSNFKLVDTYGITGVIALFTIIVVCVINVVLQIVCMKLKEIKNEQVLSRIGVLLLYVGLVVQMILSIHADAMMGFSINGEAVSPSIMILSILLIIQPFFWTDAIILDSLTTISLICVSIYCEQKYGMAALFYYIIFAIVYLFLSYLVVSILFYAETQRYCQVLRNERLYNTAMYDELTHCKNRHALREFIKENEKRWATRSFNVLLIMFDIDNFKEYNDQFSHPGGDYCLINVADAIRKQFPSPNLDFFRYGGEEFLIFMELRNINDSYKIIQQVKNSVSGLKIDAPDSAPKDVVTISVGGITFQTPTQFNFDDALKDVDKCLYKAKSAGKDACCLNGTILK